MLHLGSEGEEAIYRKSQLKSRMPVCAQEISAEDPDASVCIGHLS